MSKLIASRNFFLGVVLLNKCPCLQMTFTPSMVGMTTVDYFHVVPIGSISRTVIKCVGSSKGNQGVLPHSLTVVACEDCKQK